MRKELQKEGGEALEGIQKEFHENELLYIPRKDKSLVETVRGYSGEDTARPLLVPLEVISRTKGRSLSSNS